MAARSAASAHAAVRRTPAQLAEIARRHEATGQAARAAAEQRLANALKRLALADERRPSRTAEGACRRGACQVMRWPMRDA